MDDDLLFRYLTDQVSPAEQNAVLGWRLASPANEKRFQAFIALHALARRTELRLGKAAVPPPLALIRLAERKTAPAAAPRLRVLLSAAALAACIGLTFGVLRQLSTENGPASLVGEQFVTGPQEASTVRLRDGTVIRLAPSSELRLGRHPMSREVFLNGRAYFAVSKQPAGEPFLIETPAGRVRVLGTRFDLQSRGDDLRLIVVEGRVALSAGAADTEVSAGEITHIIDGKPEPVLRVPDAATLIDWTGDFLAFQSTYLDQAAREIESQYNVRIVLADSTLARRTVTAWFAGWELRDVLTVVCAVAEVRCSEQDSTVRMEPR